MRKQEIKMPTRDELLKELEKFERILHHSTLYHMYNLINLEESVMSDNDYELAQKEILSQIDFYRKIANYNIIERAKTICKSEGIQTTIRTLTGNTGNGFALKNVNIKSNHADDLFYYWYYNHPQEQLGIITLYQIIADTEQRIQKIAELKTSIKSLEKEKNPITYHERLSGNDEPVAGDILTDYENVDYYRWEHDRKTLIYNKKAELERLENIKDFTPQEKKQIILLDRFCDDMLKDYHLKDSDFTETDDRGHIKTLTKTTPIFIVNKNIKNY